MKKLALTGWHPGIKTVSLLQAIRAYSSTRSIADAKRSVDRLLSGEKVVLHFSSEAQRDQFAGIAEELGAVCEEE
jgi:hypothetical protein